MKHDSSKPAVSPADDRTLYRRVARAKIEWEAAVDAVTDLVFLTDPKGRVLRCNEAAREALDRPFHRILGDRLDKLILSAWGCPGFRLGSATGEVHIPKVRRILEYSRFSASSEGSELGFVLVFRDITELRHLRSVAGRIDMMNNLGHVLSCVRHEIGNPTNAIKTALTVMAESLHEFSTEKTLSYIERCQNDIRRIQDLLERLRTLNLFEVPSTDRVDLRAFLTKEIPAIREGMMAKGIHLELPAASEGRAIWAVCNAQALYQVLLGLVANAVEAVAEQDRPGVVRIDLRDDDPETTLAVSDNGPGIEPELTDKVVLPLFTTKPTGTGLGLAIADTLLTGMGGALEIGNDPELGGARIVMRLRADAAP